MRTLYSFLLFFALVAAIPAHAQTTDAEFCAMAPVEMLAALDGNWKLKPGAGAVIAGGRLIPLPAQGAQALSFTYDADTASVNIVDGATGENFMMVPTTPEAAKTILGLLKDWYSENFLVEGKGCDWYSMPLMIASNVYSLAKAAPGPNKTTGFAMTFDKTVYYYCPTGVDGKQDLTFVMLEASNISSESKTSYLYNDGAVDDPDAILSCPAKPVPAPGQLVMNLVVKFQGPDSGTGVLHFEGEMGGYAAVATRPVTLSR